MNYWYMRNHYGILYSLSDSWSSNCFASRMIGGIDLKHSSYCGFVCSRMGKTIWSTWSME